MKPKIFLFLLVLAALFACNEEVSNFEIPDQLIKEFPDRPVIAPGESTQLIKPRSATIVADMNTLTAQDLVDVLIGTGPAVPTITNINYTGDKEAAGIFSDVTDVFGFTGGIVLSSGVITNIVGPNLSDGATGNHNLPGDPDLDELIPESTNDAAILEFDFECEFLDEISFRYVFASEEYNEYVFSTFNDVFGFFVNGVDIANIPGTNIAVSVNSLNCGNPFGTADNYCSLFKNNDLSDGGPFFDTEADGFTVVLTATTPVEAGVNHFKLAIADASDWILDSHVLLEAGSFVCAPPVIPVVIDVKPGSDPNAINCQNEKLTIPVAILTTDDFDATTVDHTTVVFQGAYEFHVKKGEMKRHEEDVDYDGDIDLVFHFKYADTDLDCTFTEGILTGELFDGSPIIGVDALYMVNTN